MWLTRPFQATFFSRAPAVVKMHLGTIPTAHKRKTLEKPTLLVNSHLVINIYLQERLIKRCLISIFQQFYFVTSGSIGLCSAPRAGAAWLQEQHLSGIPGKRGNPRAAPPRLPSVSGLLPLGVSVHSLHPIERLGFDPTF